MNEIKFPSINSKNKKEKEMARVALNLKIDYSKNNLSKQDIEEAESIPGWSWELSSEEKLYLSKKK